MRILHLSATNFKGSTFSHKLAPVTLITGNNFAGKSSRVEALTLALAGHLPGVERKADCIFDRAASGSTMQVKATIDKDKEIVRTYGQKGASVKCSESGTWGAKLPPELFDATEYLGLSAPERVKFLFARVPLPDGTTLEGAFHDLTDVLRGQLDEVPRKAADHLHELIERVRGEYLSANQLETPLQAWIEDLAGKAREWRLESERREEQMRATVKGLESVQMEQPANVAAPEDLAKLRSQFGNEQAKCSKAVADLRTSQQQLAETESLLTSTARLSKGTEVQLKEAEQDLDQLMKNPVKAPDTTRTCHDALQKAEAKHFRANNKMVAGQAVSSRLKNEVAELNKTGTCPQCGQSLAKLRKELLNRLAKDSEQADQELAEDLSAVRTAKKEMDAAKSAVDQWYKTLRARSEWEGKVNTAREKVNKLKVSVKQIMDAKDHLARHKNLIAQTDALKAQADKACSDSDKLAKDIGALDREAKIVLNWRAQQVNLNTAQEEAKNASFEVQASKVVCEAVSKLQEQLLQRVINPFLNDCNRLCGGILREPLVYQDGEIGMLRGNGTACRFISHRTFSGTEKALAYCAISLGLAAKAPMRLVILDELGRLDENNKQMVFDRVCMLVAKQAIDQAILIDTANNMMTDGFDPFVEIKL